MKRIKIAYYDIKICQSHGMWIIILFVFFNAGIVLTVIFLKSKIVKSLFFCKLKWKFGSQKKIFGFLYPESMYLYSQKNHLLLFLIKELFFPSFQLISAIFHWIFFLSKVAGHSQKRSKIDLFNKRGVYGFSYFSIILFRNQNHPCIYIQSNLLMWSPLLSSHLYLKFTFSCLVIENFLYELILF